MLMHLEIFFSSFSGAVIRWLTERLPEGLGGVEEVQDKPFILFPVCFNF